jgi:putative membrane protein
MIRTLTACAVTALLVAAPAWAQQTGVSNPAGTPPGTPQSAPGVPAASQPNDADRIFVHAIAIGNRAEIVFARLADQHTQVAAIRQFAQLMVEDHTKAGNRLVELARPAGLPIPEGVDQDHRTQQAAIERLNGTVFDDAYIRGQITDHQQAVQLLEFEIDSGQDPALKQFAVETLPIFMHHLELAQALAAETMGVATRDGPSGMGPHRDTAAPARDGGAAPTK